MSTLASDPLSPRQLQPEEEQILKAVRELQFGAVEIVIHDRRVTEIRQTRKTRFPSARTASH